MDPKQTPTEMERRMFVVKLAEFRSTLPSLHQHMLDALVGAAVTGREPVAVQAYWIGTQEDPAKRPASQG